MDPEQWKQVDELLQSVLALPIDERNEFLNRTCAGNDEVEREVRSLLQAHQKVGGFLETAAIDVAARAMARSDSQERGRSIVGQTVSHYRVLRVLGSGGMGVVYQAQDIRLGRQVALKFLPGEVALDREAFERLQREARAASALDHPNICSIYELDEHAGRPFIVMQLLEGQTLRAWIDAGSKEDLKTRLGTALSLAIQIADALEAAHQKGIIHRDIKPANVFITPRGHAKILDFGLAKVLEESPAATTPPESPAVSVNRSGLHLTLTGTTMGTASYMSPEQVRGEKLDARTDLFSLGLVLYEMVTGQKAFAGDTFAAIHDATLHREPIPARELNPAIPSGLERIIRKATEKDRALRYGSAEEMGGDLERLRKETSAPAAEPATPLPAVSVFEDKLSDLLRSVAEPQLVAAPPVAASRARRWWPIGLLATVLLAATGGAVYWYQHHSSFRITSQDTLVLADFANSTGEAVFDDSLRQALEIGLRQSPFLNVLSDRKVGRILKQMGRSGEERMTGRTAVEVCQRANSKVTVQGSIASLGATYLIGLAAIRCDNGELLANEQLQAKRKEDVVDVLGQASSHLRARLGESLPSIQKFNAPLEQATTPSLDALKAYSLALSTWDKRGDRDSLPFFKQAADLDPNFAMAYVGVATIYRNLGETKLARENAAKAYALRNRLTETERSSIEARYYAYVTGELEKAASVYALEVQNYQSAGAYNHLASNEGDLGLYELSAGNLRKALTLDATRGNTYLNLAIALLALNRVDEASTVLADAGQRKLQAEGLLQAAYWIAFLRGDSRQMQHFLQLSSETPGETAVLLSNQSNTEAYYGHFEKARELSHQAATLMEKNGDKESAALCLAQAAVREAEVGSNAHAREFLAQAQKLSRGRDVTTLTALAMARMGNDKQAEILSHALGNDWPLGTYVQKYWLPLIRAEDHLQKRLASKAIDDLTVVTPPLEFAAPLALQVATLYPTFLRAHAYLVAGDGGKALAELHKLADHRSYMVNSALWPLSRVDLARAYARTGDSTKARQSCEDFLQLWKDADADLPILQEAQAECRKFQ